MISRDVLSSYPVKDRRPSFHCHTLKHREHRESNVVEGSDAEVWSLPFLQADGDVLVAGVGARWGVFRIIGVAGHVILAFSHDTGWK